MFMTPEQENRRALMLVDLRDWFLWELHALLPKRCVREFEAKSEICSFVLEKQFYRKFSGGYCSASFGVTLDGWWGSSS